MQAVRSSQFEPMTWAIGASSTGISPEQRPATSKRMRNRTRRSSCSSAALALNARLKALEERQHRLEFDLEAMAMEVEPLLHPNLAELYRQKVANLADAIHAPESRDEAFEVIRSLLDRVVLTPGEDALRIDLEGDLAGILSLCDSSK